MDDVGPAVHARGDSVQAPTHRDAQHQPWSCIDYVDFQHNSDEEPTEGSAAGTAEATGSLSARFGGITGHNDLREDSKGTCFKKTEGGQEVRDKCGNSITLDMGDGATEKQHKWWTDKQTNHGWPGTAEGKINTAQGMAGDLVGKLDSEEKNAIAGI